ncbi:MAG: hypothetical protein QNK31_07280 [Porticoccus sp.]|nr:hypothetical protein [Porticoccus sp.]
MKRLFGVLVVLLLLAGCAPVMVPVGDSTPAPRTPSTPVVPADIPEPAGDVIVPNSPPQQSSSHGAVAKLLKDAWRYNRSGEYDRSNVVAERAMRINHTEPEIYLVMASNYFSSAQLHMAEQLATQGLPLASNNYSVRRSLQQLLLDIRTKLP